MNMALIYIVEPDYLATMASLSAGPLLHPAGRRTIRALGCDDDTFARKYFGGEDPIGKAIHLEGAEAPSQIIGVVGHVMQWSIDSNDKEELQAQLYLRSERWRTTIVPIAWAWR